jgi:hypothetical protein
LFLLQLFLSVLPAAAQVTTATILGTVKDQSGAVLPGVTVTATNENTGTVRTVQTDDAGRYRIPALSVGRYTLLAELSGFRSEGRQGIMLAVGQELPLELTLIVGDVSEVIAVTSEAPVVQTTSAAVSGVVEQTRIANLPLNGRDFTQLALVQPGVLQGRKTDARATKGFGTRISMAGSRVDQTAWLLDGTNIRGAAIFGVPGASSGLVLGVEAVAEFQVLTSNYSAEVGGTSGGVVNMVSKSGTNRFHGSLYAFHRNDGLDALNYFDVEQPEFHRNQFGGSLGGPIKRDRLLFFVNYEGLEQDLGQTAIAIVPDANAHLGLVPTATGGLQQVQVAPSIRPFLDMYPLPNGPPVGTNSGLAQLISHATDVTDQHFFTGRLDYRLGTNTNIFGRLTFDDRDQVHPSTVPITGERFDTQTRYLTLQFQRVMTSNFLATTRFAHNRSSLDNPKVLFADFPAGTIKFNPELPAQVGFTGANEIGPDGLGFTNVHNLYQFTQAMDYTRGAHSMKFGADVQILDMNYDQAFDHGRFGWASLRDFLIDAPLQTFSGAAPGSDAQRQMRQQYYGLYFQDDWRMRPGLTLNLGVRYDPFTVPDEKNDKLTAFKDWRTATEYEFGIPYFRNPSKKNVSPRVGFAWDPWNDGKTAIRGGAGVFFGSISGPQYRSGSLHNPPLYGEVNQPLGNMASALDDAARVAPSLLLPALTPTGSVQRPDWYIDPSYETKFNISIEREFPGALSLMAGYIGGRGNNLWRLSSCNAAPSVFIDGREFVARGTPRPNPNMGNCSMNFSDAQSFYDGLLLEVKKRVSSSFQVQASYTWSKSVDDTTTGAVATDYLEGDTSRPYNLRADRGLSATHLGKNLVINGLYALPSFDNAGWGGRVLGDWHVSMIFKAASGTPFSPGMSGRHVPDLSRQAGRQRPDVVAGASYKDAIDPGNPNQYFDPSIFVMPPAGFYGEAGRNVLIGPGLFLVDLGIRKSLSLGGGPGGRQLEIRAEMFNVTNRANFANPNSTVLNGANGQRVASAGLITSTVTTGRQIQLGARLSF